METPMLAFLCTAMWRFTRAVFRSPAWDWMGL